MSIGQSVCVKNETVIAVEAIEGTDECIRRAGELCKQGGFVVVKVAKPQQDMRFDVPTIGMGTLERLVASGGKVLAVEAEKTIFVDEAEVCAAATKQGVSIVAVRGE
jgi:UDP-2,3-diacylglucosamine hydrolase